MNLPLATDRLVLRPFRDADLAAFLAYRNDPVVARLQSWDEMSLDSASALIRTNSHPALVVPGDWRQIALALESDDLLVGDIGLFVSADGRIAEVGFTMSRQYQGRGLMREAMTRLLDALAGEPPLERIEAVIDERNAAAIALVTRLGFELHSTSEAIFKGETCRERKYVWLLEPQRRSTPNK